MSIENNRRRFVSLGNILTILAMATAVAVTYADNRVENARQKERVDNLKDEAKEIKKDVKETAKNVDLILRKLDAWEATQRERERVARERRQ